MLIESYWNSMYSSVFFVWICILGRSVGTTGEEGGGASDPGAHTHTHISGRENPGNQLKSMNMHEHIFNNSTSAWTCLVLHCFLRYDAPNATCIRNAKSFCFVLLNTCIFWPSSPTRRVCPRICAQPFVNWRRGTPLRWPASRIGF